MFTYVEWESFECSILNMLFSYVEWESFEGRVFKICGFLMWSGNHLKEEFLKYVVSLKGVESFVGSF